MSSPAGGGRPGDAYVIIHTGDDPRFTRAGADLWHDLHIQAPDAALGVTTAVPAPGGQARVRVPPGTQPGSVLRRRQGTAALWRARPRQPEPHRDHRHSAAAQRTAKATLRAAPGRGCRDEQRGGRIP